MNSALVAPVPAKPRTYRGLAIAILLFDLGLLAWGAWLLTRPPRLWEHYFGISVVGRKGASDDILAAWDSGKIDSKPLRLQINRASDTFVLQVEGHRMAGSCRQVGGALEMSTEQVDGKAVDFERNGSGKLGWIPHAMALKVLEDGDLLMSGSTMPGTGPLSGDLIFSFHPIGEVR